MFGKTGLRLATSLILASLVEPASALGTGGVAVEPADVKNTAFLSPGARILAPFAHVLFCHQNPGECTVKTEPVAARGVAEGTRLSQLDEVNRSVNRTIIPTSDDPAVLGGDRWELSPVSGDCEDFAITKRHRLIALGWPSSDLRLAVAVTKAGEGHLVLVVRTSTGDLVLDNRTNAIKPWNRTGLAWSKIQSAENPRVWLSL